MCPPPPRASLFLEYWVTLKEAHREVEKEHGAATRPSPPSSSSSSPHPSHPSHPISRLWPYLRRRARLVGHAIITALPSLAQSAVLGTAVFSIYEDVKAMSDSWHGVSEDGTEGPRAPQALGPVLSSSFLAGGLAGGTHGALFTAGEHAVRAVRGGAPPALHVAGTLASHALSHATLFGTYEVSKQGLMNLTGTDHVHPLGVLAVAAAGGLAGESVQQSPRGWVQVQACMRDATPAGQ